MYKTMAALMIVITIIGFSIILMLAQVVSSIDEGNLFSQIPTLVYILIVIAIVICVSVFSLEEKNK